MRLEGKSTLWLKVVLVVAIALSFGYSAYWGAQRSQQRVAALETRQAALLLQVSKQGTLIARVSTPLSSSVPTATLAPTTISVTPTPTLPTGGRGIETPKETAVHPVFTMSPSTQLNCPHSVEGTIDTLGGKAALFLAPFLTAKQIAELLGGTKVKVCGRTSAADWAKIQWQGKEGWVQADLVELPIGMTWMNVPVDE